jgi:hypothetical protein
MVDVEVDEKAEKKKGKKDDILERKKRYVYISFYTTSTATAIITAATVDTTHD